MIWLKEIFNPALKCDRVGHSKTVPCSYVIIMRPNGGWRKVADEYIITEYVCRRCRKAIFAKLEFVGGIQSLSLPASEMREFEHRGWIYLN